MVKRLTRAQRGARARWAATTPEEFKRLSELHSKATGAYWATRTPEERKARGQYAADARWGKRDEGVS